MHKVVIQFDGHEYFGWQIQNQVSPTVQEKFNNALAKIYKQPIKTIGSGRTDTGVHSLEHHVVYKAPFKIPTEKIILALNGNLPDSIRAISCKIVSDDFRPTYNAISREYKYFFSNQAIPSPIVKNYMTNVSYDLNFDTMKQACELFVGTKDFKSFHCVGSEPSTTIRTIFSCELKREPSCFSGIIPAHFVIVVKGNGFLKQMVRLIVGSVWAVGRGKISLEDIKRELSEASGQHLCAVAPPYGLFKVAVEYPKED